MIRFRNNIMFMCNLKKFGQVSARITTRESESADSTGRVLGTPQHEFA
jgi:hypothetical protein